MKLQLLIFAIFLSSFQIYALETIIKTKEKVYAIGDIHGDLERAKNILKSLGLIDNKGKWIAKKSILVQTGDQIDRYYHDRETLDYFEDLRIQAKAVGGRVFSIVGNHEINNVRGKLYNLPNEALLSFKEFNDLYDRAPQNCKDRFEKRLDQYIESALPWEREALREEIEEKKSLGMKGRMAVFCEGGKYAKIVGKWHTVLIINDTIYTHGSLIRKYSKGGLPQIRELNKNVSLWFKGKKTSKDFYKSIIRDMKAPFEQRYFARNISEKKCFKLTQVLNDLGAKRMVVGHTVQDDGITSACGNKILRIDTGFSRGFGLTLNRKIEALSEKGHQLFIHKLEDEFRNPTIIKNIRKELLESSFNCRSSKSSRESDSEQDIRCPSFLIQNTFRNLLLGKENIHKRNFSFHNSWGICREKYNTCRFKAMDNIYEYNLNPETGISFQSEKEMCNLKDEIMSVIPI